MPQGLPAAGPGGTFLKLMVSGPRPFSEAAKRHEKSGQGTLVDVQDDVVVISPALAARLGFQYLTAVLSALAFSASRGVPFHLRNRQRLLGIMGSQTHEMVAYTCSSSPGPTASALVHLYLAISASC